jgi:hypothetical protein
VDDDSLLARIRDCDTFVERVRRQVAETRKPCEHVILDAPPGRWRTVDQPVDDACVFGAKARIHHLDGSLPCPRSFEIRLGEVLLDCVEFRLVGRRQRGLAYLVAERPLPPGDRDDDPWMNLVLCLYLRCVPRLRVVRRQRWRYHPPVRRIPPWRVREFQSRVGHIGCLVAPSFLNAGKKIEAINVFEPA